MPARTLTALPTLKNQATWLLLIFVIIFLFFGRQAGSVTGNAAIHQAFKTGHLIPDSLVLEAGY